MTAGERTDRSSGSGSMGEAIGQPPTGHATRNWTPFQRERAAANIALARAASESTRSDRDLDRDLDLEENERVQATCITSACSSRSGKVATFLRMGDQQILGNF
jgi:hypothetical protein